MKPLASMASLLGLAASLGGAQAQTPVTSHDNPTPAAPAPKTANQRAATYKGPKVVGDSKALGHKMIQKSQPADGPNRADILFKNKRPVPQK